MVIVITSTSQVTNFRYTDSKQRRAIAQDMFCVLKCEAFVYSNVKHLCVKYRTEWPLMLTSFLQLQSLSYHVRITLTNVEPHTADKTCRALETQHHMELQLQSYRCKEYLSQSIVKFHTALLTPSIW